MIFQPVFLVSCPPAVHLKVCHVDRAFQWRESRFLGEREAESGDTVSLSGDEEEMNPVVVLNPAVH